MSDGTFSGLDSIAPIKWKNLVDYVRDTARLRLEIKPYQNDQKAKNKGQRIIYAVDTNIVALFVQPEIAGPLSSRGHNGFTKVFHNDRDETAQLIGAAISRFIFYALNEAKRPLFILGGHDAEVRDMYDYFAVAADRFDSVVFSEREKFKKALGKIKDEPNQDEQIAVLNAIAPKLISHLFFNENPNSKLRRINRLIASGAFLSLSRATNQVGLLDNDREIEKRLWEILDIPRNLADQIEEGGLRRKWLEALIVKKNEGISERRLRADCAALAKLEIINRRLKNENAKIVLISADCALHHAADDYFPDGNENESFKQQYIRHPLAFLTVPEVLFPGSAKNHRSDEGEDSNAELLGTLLVKYSGDDGVDDNVLRKLASSDQVNSDALITRAKRVARTDPGGALSIRSQWRALTNELRNAHSLTSELAKAEMKNTFRTVFKLDSAEALNLIDTKLTEKREETWKDFLASFFRMGYDILSYDADTNSRRRRNVPPINFTSLPNTGIFVRKLMGSSNIGEFRPKEFSQLFDKIDDDDETGYARSLAYGLLFAYEGRWHVASILAKHAIDIAQRQNRKIVRAGLEEQIDGESDVYITGREAYYFLAVSKRLAARSLEELDTVERFIDRATLVLDSEQEKGFSSDLTGIRFRVEKLALKLARLQFKYFLNDGNGERFERDDWIKLVNNQTSELDKCDAITDRWIGLNIKRSILCNFYMTLAVLDNENELDDSLLEAGRSIFIRFKENFECTFKEDEFEIPVTNLVRMVYDYAIVKYKGVDINTKKEIRLNIETFSNEVIDNKKRAYLTAYDQPRFKLLRDLLETHVGS